MPKSLFHWTVVIITLTLCRGAFAQEGRATVLDPRSRELTFEPRSPGVLFGALDPTIKKWYVPQELYREYGWRQWEYTNYAKERYLRYVEVALEGDYLYDLFGRFVTRGWLVYNWRHTTPMESGSGILRAKEFFNWFDGVVIAMDSKGEYHSALTLSNKLRTTLTPLTFSKPTFDGVQWDFQSDKYQATIIASRVNDPGSSTESPAELTDVGLLLGGRATVQLGDFVKVGATYVNLHHSQTSAKRHKGSLTRGTLTRAQNQFNISTIIVRLSDDSPEDGEGGAALYGERIVLTDLKGRAVDNRDLRLNMPEWPTMEGGYRHEGFSTADGTETITLTYDFTADLYRTRGGIDPAEIKQVVLELLVGNDYRIEVSSDRQTDKGGVPVFLSQGIPERAIRAPGNVKDNSNQQIVRISYGLPTGAEVYGFTIEVQDLAGFDAYLEFDMNRRFSQYPNLSVDPGKHAAFTDRSRAWMAILTKRAYPWFGFAEAFSLDPDYSTSVHKSYFRQGQVGHFDYGDSEYNVYEFVDDNDDQDRYPDWRRGGATFDRAIFPGWDENNDFVSDFNQNDSEKDPNFIPDYEEPFLRYGSDRPEFLFGLDMNHNGWVDRFEDDEQPDYPYKRGHRGYNIYAGVHLIPNVRLTVGRAHEWLLAEKKQSRNTYLLFTFDRDYAQIGRIQIYDNFRLVKDRIPDPFWRWPNSISKATPKMEYVGDPLAAPDTWVHTVFLGYTYEQLRGFRFDHKLKWERYAQRPDAEKLEERRPDLRKEASFFGTIQKADYTLSPVGELTLKPRVKSEFLKRRPFLRLTPGDKESPQNVEQRDYRFLAGLLAAFPVLKQTRAEVGLEYFWFNQLLEDQRGQPKYPGFQDPDFNEWVMAFQFSNISAYLGYKINTQVGVSVTRRKLATEEEGETESTAFLKMMAGVD